MELKSFSGNDMTVDDRAYLMHLIPSLRTEDALTLLYPTVFPISDLVLEQQPAEVFSLHASLNAIASYYCLL